MKNQLTQDEIQKLFDFVKSKFVRFEDLKYELVDHLASSIEDLQNQNPEMTFDEGLKETYSRFPITGFTNFVAEKQKALSRYWMRKFFFYYIEFFKLPKIILLVAIAFSVWTMFQLIPHGFMYILMVAYAGALFIKDISLAKRLGKRVHKYMFMSTYFGQLFSINTILFYLVIQLPIADFWNIVYPLWMTITLSIIIALETTINYAITVVFPKMLEEEINTKYAHLNIKIAI